jgi:ADP-ribose pyrophosphatase YjhB (NUDIX family)
MTNTNKSYTASLPKKRIGAGCLMFNEQGKILLVKPTYKPGWEIPGGVVEENESPRQCCQRELREELGLERKIGALLVVDYNHETDEQTESLMFIFDGGILYGMEITSIKLPKDELSEFAFFTRQSLPQEMEPALRKRISAIFEQAAQGTGIYIENQ